MRGFIDRTVSIPKLISLARIFRLINEEETECDRMKSFAVTWLDDFFLADHVMDAMLLLISGGVMNVCQPSTLSHFILE